MFCRNLATFFCATLLVASCASTPPAPTPHAAAEPLAVQSLQPAPHPVQTWMERAVQDYIENADAPLLVAIRSLGTELSWMTDRIVTTDSAEFTVVQIGHDQTEPDGTNPRFVTDAWIYLDTAGRRIYEYDLPNDSLVCWN